jgi:secondary thiamine-phosphate synthase enzyme
MQKTLVLRIDGPSLFEFTREVARFLRDSEVSEGLLTLFVQHTSCSLLVQENADPDVRRDLDELFRRLVSAQGPDTGIAAARQRGFFERVPALPAWVERLPGSSGL